MLTISEVLSHLLSVRGITESSLAKALSVPRATINKIRSGKIINPRSSTLSMIANYFDINVDQLIGVAPLLSDYELKFTQIPLINLEDAADIERTLKNITFINHKHWTIIEWAEKSKNKSGLFAIKIDSDSMLPYFDSKTTVIIDTNALVANRKYILVRISSTDDVLLRQIFIDGNTQILKPINPIFKPIELTNDDSIIGVVIQAKREF